MGIFMSDFLLFFFSGLPFGGSTFALASSWHFALKCSQGTMAVKEEIPFSQSETTDPYMVGFVREAMETASPGGCK